MSARVSAALAGVQSPLPPHPLPPSRLFTRGEKARYRSGGREREGETRYAVQKWQGYLFFFASKAAHARIERLIPVGARRRGKEVTFFINVTVQGTVSRDCLRAEPRSDRMNWEINGL